MGGGSTRGRWTAAIVGVAALFALVAAVAAGKPAHHHAKGSRPHPSHGVKSPGGGKSLNPGKPIQIGLGYRPQGLVDEAGVAHITWSTPSWSRSAPRPRTKTPPAGTTTAGSPAARAAAATTPNSKRRSSTLPGGVKALELENPFVDNSPGANQDIGEGSLPLETGDQLSILAHRPGNKVEVPGGISEDVNFLF